MQVLRLGKVANKSHTLIIGLKELYFALYRLYVTIEGVLFFTNFAKVLTA